MFDHEEEDKDLDSQVAKSQTIRDDVDRATREETPGPEAPDSTEKHQIPNSTERGHSDVSSSTITESSDSTETTKTKVIPESALPDKIVGSPSTEGKK